MELKTRICFLGRHDTSNNEFKIHSHNCYEMVYVLSGKGDSVIRGKRRPLCAHTYYIIPPKTEHVERLEGYGEILFIGFECDNTQYAPGDVVVQNAPRENALLLQNIFDEYKNQEMGYEIAGKALLDLLLLSVLRATMANNKKCKDLDYIKTYIEQYSNQKIDFGELARLSGYSYDYFRMMFKKKFGTSPQTYMIHTRLERARQMLEETDLSCTQIAYNCGFSNSAQMSVMFKKHFGILPSAVK